VQPDIVADPYFSQTVGQPRRFMPLKGLANILTALLASDLVLTAVELVQAHAAGDQPWEVQIDSRPWVVGSRIAVAATGILFLIWFRRAKINAEHFDSQRRYGRGWAFWGWIVPVVNFWIPFQIMDDLLRASRPSWSSARKTWLPMAWWISWTLFASLYLLQQGSLVALGIWYSSPTMHAGYGPRLPDSWPSFYLFAFAGTACMTLIRDISWGKLGVPDGASAESVQDSPALTS
jgi:hypothetical protein